MIGFHAAVDAGSLPFGCQGSDNGLTIEGGETLGYEMISSLRAGGKRLDRLFIQVGGGALASACIQAIREAIGLGVLDAWPRIHAVQTRGAYPLVRAYDRVCRHIMGDHSGPPGVATDDPVRLARRADEIRRLAATQR